MAVDPFDNLLCEEDPEEILGIDGGNATDECSHSRSQENHQTDHQNPDDNNSRPQRLVGLPPMRSVESLMAMFEKEREFLPKGDYLNRMRTGDLELSVRREALDWIWKADAHFNFGPLCVCLSVNYFDRMLSVYDIPRGQSWISQLLAVTCFSLAVKVEEERKVPHCVDLQVGNPKDVFESKSIQRMEKMVLRTLKWRMQAITPYSFIDCFLSKMSDDHDQPPLRPLLSRSVQLILSTIKGIDFLEFRSSEIAAAVAISVSGETQVLDIDKAMSSFIHVEKGRVMKCLELLEDLSLTRGFANVGNAHVPQSPAGVLDAACSSSKSDDITVGSCASSSHSNPDSKRRKLD